MKVTIIILILTVLAACTPKGMSLEEQATAVTACKKAGGTPEEIRYVDGSACAKVNCYFAEKPRAFRDREGKPCIDKGGIPIFSSWDGTLKDCKFNSK